MKSARVVDYIEAYRLLDGGSERAGGLFADLAAAYPDDPLIALHARRLAAGQSGTLITMDEK